MAGEKTETGTGGINIDDNVYGMDVGVPDAEGGSQGQWSGGNINVDKSVKDISKPTKETFAKYMSKTTLGQAGSSTHPNAYPVGKGDGTKALGQARDALQEALKAIEAVEAEPEEEEAA